MPWSYAKDPVTGDRIKNGTGGFVKTYTAENLVRNQLLAHQGECWQDAELGSLLHDRERFRGNPAVLIKDEVKRTLERVVNAGRIANLEVDVKAGRTGRVDGTTRFLDTSAGQLVSTKLPVGG